MLFARHLLKGNGLASLRHRLDDAGILDGEKALGDRDIEVAGQHEGAERDEQRFRLMIEDTVSERA